MTERTYISMQANGLLEEFKRHIRMTSDDLDAELRSKMMAAVISAEHHIGKVILRSEFVPVRVRHDQGIRLHHRPQGSERPRPGP